FPDLMHFIKCHLFIGSIFYCCYMFSVNFIFPYLTQEYTMCTDICFGLVFLNTVGDKCGGNSALSKNILYFLFICHDSSSFIPPFRLKIILLPLRCFFRISAAVILLFPDWQKVTITSSAI